MKQGKGIILMNSLVRKSKLHHCREGQNAESIFLNTHRIKDVTAEYGMWLLG